jgi:excinuclease ABC subunit A
VVKCADWIVDLGPEGGSGGGRVVAEGTPEQVVTVPGSHTGRFLAPVLAGRASVTPSADGAGADAGGAAGSGPVGSGVEAGGPVAGAGAGADAAPVSVRVVEPAGTAG